MNEFEAIQFQLATAFGKGWEDQFTIISRDTQPEGSQLYHVSTDTEIKSFYPRMSTRLYDNETKAIPRLSTSPTLLQCLIGRGVMDIEQQMTDKKGNQSMHYCVYRMDWRYAVRPTEKHVPDTSRTGEHWLLFPDPDHREHIGHPIAVMFVVEYRIIPYMDVGAHGYRLCIHLKEELPLYRERVLTPGHYLIDIEQWVHPKVEANPDNIVVTPITDLQYEHYRARRYSYYSKKKEV